MLSSNRELRRRIWTVAAVAAVAAVLVAAAIVGEPFAGRRDGGVAASSSPTASSTETARVSSSPFITTAPQRAIHLYYYSPAEDKDERGNIQCSEKGLVAVERRIPLTQTPVQDAVRLLLKGEMTPEERARGITTEFPLAGLELRGASLENGVLTLSFADPNYATTGGACRTGILAFQIRKTAGQFEGVEQVRFQPQDVFQP